MSTKVQWDAFVSHASEDKETVARPIFELLSKMGARVWFDEAELTVGDSLLTKIDEGLAKSRFGIVVLSKAFLQKDWPDYELRGLVSREMGRDKVVLPVWYGLSRDDLLDRMPTMADKLAITTDGTDIELVCSKLLGVIRPELGQAIMRRMAYRLALSRADRKTTKLSKLKVAPPRHDELPIGLLARVRLIRAALIDVRPMSFDDWVYGFRCDAHPSREIEIWERIAARYLEVVKLSNPSKEEAAAIFGVCLLVSMGIPIDRAMEKEALSRRLVPVVRGTVSSERPLDDLADGAFADEVPEKASLSKEMLEDLDMDGNIDETTIDRILAAHLAERNSRAT